jgi:hypothetical protein
MVEVLLANAHRLDTSQATQILMQLGSVADMDQWERLIEQAAAERQVYLSKRN